MRQILPTRLSKIRGWLFRRLVQRRACLLPTWRGWLVLLVVAAVIFSCLVRATFPFLAVHDSKPGGALVVEGWMPDYALSAAIDEFRRNPYQVLLVSGGPIEKGGLFADFGTWAQLGAATIVKIGGDAARVHPVPAPEVRKDRTYASAVAVRAWLREHGGIPAQINLASLGPHSRRTRMLYEAAFAGVAEVGIIPLEDRSYDGRRWWTSSDGFRTVSGEAIAYTYARLLFRAPGAAR